MPFGVTTEIAGGLGVLGLSPPAVIIEPVNLAAATALLQTPFLELSGRALPYRPVRWSGRQRVKTTFYQGNPVGTQQVLGPEETPTVMKGMWKDRYLGGGGKAQRMVEQFDNLMRSGLLCKVTWGTVIRFGVLAEFSADYERKEDIAWEMRWEWSSRDQSIISQVANAIFNAVDTLTSLNNAVAGLIETVRNLDKILPQVFATLKAPFDNYVKSVENLTASIGVNLRRRSTPEDAVGILNLSAEAKESALAMKNILDNLDDEDDQPDTPLAPTLGESIIEFNVVREGIIGKIRAFLILLLLYETFFLALTGSKEASATAPAKEGETLRDLARRTTGSSANWTAIADANKIDSSTVKGGQVLAIPRIR